MGLLHSTRPTIINQYKIYIKTKGQRLSFEIYIPKSCPTISDLLFYVFLLNSQIFHLFKPKIVKSNFIMPKNKENCEFLY